MKNKICKLVADHLEMIAYYRINKNYSEYFNALDHLYTITEFKFKERTKEKSLDVVKIEKLVEDYKKLRYNVVIVANKFTTVWFGRSRDPDGVAAIEFALKALERYLLFKMNEANMFGSKREVEGLI